MSWFCFECGIIGGFVSIQQRLKRVSDEELTYLSQSWTSILVVPVFGGVFALVLYLLFLAGIVKGPLFPKITIPPFTTEAPTIEELKGFFTETLPASGSDFAKLAFWCFVAGFSERFVPQIIQRVSNGGEQAAGSDRQRRENPEHSAGRFRHAGAGANDTADTTGDPERSR
jgi:hypothetical protein